MIATEMLKKEMPDEGRKLDGCLASRFLLKDTTNLSVQQKSSETHHHHQQQGVECNDLKCKENGCDQGNEGGAGDDLFDSEDYIYTNSKP
ncbi:unnamed protein product [Victoria cruziana]